MRYKVTRTSDWADAEKPCEEAVPIGDKWYVDINSLEDLMAFIGRHGKVVVRSNWIEIYDDYRE